VPTYVALLRGINVGGRNRLAMADLRALLLDLDCRDPRTYVQSGNAVFTSDRDDAAGLAAAIEARIAVALDLRPAVLLRTSEELSGIVAANPYAEAAAADPTRVHVAFLSAEPDDPATLTFDAEEFAPDAVSAGDRVRYLHLPGGMSRSRLAEALSRRRGDVQVTVRNWRTVTALLDMTA
jgi:uncharacterized protein (DUF1697 family)